MARITKPVEERRQEIIDTARTLFIRKGFDKTAVADVSKEINVAQGLVYHYFKSKTELLYAVVDELATEHVAVAEKTISEYKGSSLECLNILLTNEAKINNYGKLFPSLMENQGIMEYVSKILTISTTPLLLSLIERGNKDGSWNCEYPKESADFILQGISGAFVLSSPSTKDIELKQAFRSIILRVLGSTQTKLV